MNVEGAQVVRLLRQSSGCEEGPDVSLKDSEGFSSRSCGLQEEVVCGENRQCGRGELAEYWRWRAASAVYSGNGELKREEKGVV
jgi:hypothetical protein